MNCSIVPLPFQKFSELLCQDIQNLKIPCRVHDAGDYDPEDLANGEVYGAITSCCW